MTFDEVGVGDIFITEVKNNNLLLYYILKKNAQRVIMTRFYYSKAGSTLSVGNLVVVKSEWNQDEWSDLSFEKNTVAKMFDRLFNADTEIYIVGSASF